MEGAPVAAAAAVVPPFLPGAPASAPVGALTAERMRSASPSSCPSSLASPSRVRPCVTCSASRACGLSGPLPRLPGAAGGPATGDTPVASTALPSGRAVQGSMEPALPSSSPPPLPPPPSSPPCTGTAMLASLEGAAADRRAAAAATAKGGGKGGGGGRGRGDDTSAGARVAASVVASPGPLEAAAAGAAAGAWKSATAC